METLETELPENVATSSCELYTEISISLGNPGCRFWGWVGAGRHFIPIIAPSARAVLAELSLHHQQALTSIQAYTTMSELPYARAHPIPRNCFSKTAASWPRLRGFQLQIVSAISLHSHLLKKAGPPLNFQIGSRAGRDKRPTPWDALLSLACGRGDGDLWSLRPLPAILWFWNSFRFHTYVTTTLTNTLPTLHRTIKPKKKLTV